MTRNEKAPSSKTPPLDGWLALTDDDVRVWAGAKTFARGFAYFTDGAVRDLGVAEDGSYLAWVRGTHRYATRVSLVSDQDSDLDRFQSECSCPVQYGCKHAVAVILSCVEAASRGTAVPTISDTDLRWSKVEGDESERQPKRSSRRRSVDKKLEQMLRSKSKDELVALLMAVAEQENDLRRDLEEALVVESGQWDTLLKDVRSEMLSLTDEEAWSSRWSNEGNLPDYSRFQKRLQTLLDNGYADQLVELGKELLDLGTQQVEQSNDEGETCEQITACLDVIADALVKSKITPEKKLMTAIDFLLADDYSMCDRFDAVLDAEKGKTAWSAAADELIARLKRTPAPKPGQSSWSAKYSRSGVSNLAVKALDTAGRAEEATDLCVAEAKLAGEYVRGVDRLIKVRRVDQAHRLASEGLAETPPDLRGVVRDLEERLQGIAEQRKDWPLVAAYEADHFFTAPSLENFNALLKAAKKADCEQAVKSAAFEFLQNGLRPDGDKAARRKAASGWTLPEPQLAPAARAVIRRNSPHYEVLIDIAISSKQPEEALRWYSELRKAGKQPTYGNYYGNSLDSKVAKAIVGDFPDKAAAIYLQIAEDHASQTQTSAYPEAVSNLVNAKRAYGLADRADFWPDVLSGFREKHRRKRRLLELIDGAKGLR